MFPYKNPITISQSSFTNSVARNMVFGNTFSILNIGGYMEVWDLNELGLVLTASTYPSQIQSSGNTIPINFTKGTGSVFSPDSLSLNSDNISSGRRRLGMQVFVQETGNVYQYTIDDYELLWNNLSGLTGNSGVTQSDYSTIVNSRSENGTNFINAWTGSTIEGVNGVSRENARWRIFSGTDIQITGGTYYSGTTTLDLYNNSGGTISITGFTGAITGGTINTIPKFTSPSTLGDSQIFDNGINVIIGSTTNAGYKLDVNGTSRFIDKITIGTLYPTKQFYQINANNDGAKIGFGDNWTMFGNILGGVNVLVGEYGTTDTDILQLHGKKGTKFTYGSYQFDIERIAGEISINGNFLLGTSTDAGYKLDVNGTGRFVSDILVNGLKVGKGNNSLSDNTALGTNALNAITTGNYNTGLGNYTMPVTTTGYENVGVGFAALRDNTSGYYNTALGVQSLKNNTTGNQNSSIGSYSMHYNTTGNYNSANGTQALFRNTSGIFNNANGYQALLNNTVGNYNTANGSYSLLTNTTGNNNSATGYAALYYNNGSDNVANGYEASILNSVGVQNTAIGNYSLRNSLSSFNTALGAYSLYYISTGSNNIGIGNDAGLLIASNSAHTISNNSTFIGVGTRAAADNQTNQIVIGYDATGLGSDTIVLGNDSIITTALKGNTLMGTTSVPLNAKLSIVGNATDASLRIYKNPTDVISGLPIFSIRETGRIGIGQTVSPDFKVEIRDFEATDYVVNSSTYFTPVLDNSVALSLQNAEANSGGACYLQLGPRNTQNYTAYAYIGAVSVSNNYSPRLVFGMRTGSTSYEEKMRINVDGIGMFTLGNPVATAALQIDSTTKGVLLPRMTTAQINAIVSPALGLMVYNTTLNHLCFYDGIWKKLSSSNM